MENHIKVNKTIRAALKKLELSVNEYEHYDGKINKESEEIKTEVAIYNYKDTLRLMEIKKGLK